VEHNRVKVSGFSFIYNGVNAGYPFVQAIQAIQPYVDEMVVVDMESTDETRQVLEKLGVRIIEGTWLPKQAGPCLSQNLLLNEECEHDIIWQCEADEVYAGDLARQVSYEIQENHRTEIAVYRLQVEQNFQRCRWYPTPVHRIFKRGTAVKNGETTMLHREQGTSAVFEMPPERGFLWDVTNCFRDDWVARIKQQAELWDEQPKYRYVPYHFTYAPVMLAEGQQQVFLDQEHWEWKESPFDLPTLLRPLVGVTSYRDYLRKKNLL